jgi:hypothetical protein
MTKALYTDATCSAASSMSTDKLHERVCAPYQAALTASMRRVASWNPHLHLYAAADRMWARSGSGDQGEWRTDPSEQAADLRLAVLVAEATISRRLAEDGYLSARQLSVDLRHAAAWLAAGAQFGA